MTKIDRFTRAEFEGALGNALRDVVERLGYDASLTRGVVLGEYEYHIRITGTNKRVTVRSSIPVGQDLAEAKGENSIRVRGEYWYKKAEDWITLGMPDRWTTRVPGWERRMRDKIKEVFIDCLADSRKPIPGPGTASPEREDEPISKKREGRDPGESSHSGDEVPALFELGEPVEPEGDPPSLIVLGGEVAEVEETKEILPKLDRIPNPSQAKAIEAEIGALRVLAPPGSGKTFVLEHRYSHLLSLGIEPKEIYAVTFSKNMAEDLYQRIKAKNPQIVGTAAEQQICTIHAMCYRILRKEGDKRRLAETWKVKRVIQDKAKQLWPQVSNRPGWKEIYSWVCQPKVRGLTWDEDSEFYEDVLGEYHGPKLDTMREYLDKRLHQENTLTFQDMVFDIEIKLRDEEFRTRWQSRVKHLLIDEGQDTSGQAMGILTTLAKPQNNSFLVGDSDQMLYRFAGATPEANLFEGFEDRYPESKMVHLGVNYRSTQEIVERQMQLIEYNYQGEGGPYDPKYLKTVSPRDEAPQGEKMTWTEYEGPDSEARGVTASILEELSYGAKLPQDFFVGARTRAQLGYLEGHLVRSGIPYINASGGSFWTLKHIRNAVSYLALAFDESDRDAFKRVYNIGSKWNTHPWGDEKGQYCPHRYLGKAFLGAVEESYGNAKAALFGGGHRIKASFLPGIEDLVDFVQSLQAEMAISATAAGAIDFIVEECYADWLRADEGIVSDNDDPGALDDLETLVEIASKFPDVQDFLEYVKKAQEQTEAVKDKDWGTYLVISTIHRLKGLERPIVFGIGLSEGVHKGTGEPRGLLPHTFSMIPPPNEGILPTGGRGRIEDERCIAFVLVSRAQTTIHLSGVRNYRGAEMWASRFIKELGLV